MELVKNLLRQTEKIDFFFPNNFEELMNNEYYDYDKFEWFLYYVFKLDGSKVEKLGKKGKGDGGADLIITMPQNDGSILRIGVQAKYWKNRVGTEPINQLASAKSRLNLTHLWIITTSDLTPDAKEIAESMEIMILRADDVSKLIKSMKERYEKDIEKNGESSIRFLVPTKKSVIESKPKTIEVFQTPNEESIELLKTFRVELSKKYSLYPLYNVFNNEMLISIIEQKPVTLEELSKIKGFGIKKVEMFGIEIVEFVKSRLIEKSKTELEVDQKFIDLLFIERTKIAKFNNMSEKDVFDDKVASYIAKMKPRNKETLAKVYGLKKENIDIFGDYLLKVVSKYIENNK
ncbi:MAG: HRDC domain-containing protein [Candidatus Delongbacteria bacterium]|nr:HRDC domain-containing protein [Candidatus Delongbacteria bacterium]